MAPVRKFNVEEAYGAVHQNTYKMASLTTTAIKEMKVELRAKKVKRTTLFRITNALNEIAESDSLDYAGRGRGRKPSTVFDENCNGFRVLNFKRKKEYNAEFAKQLVFKRNAQEGKFGVVVTAKASVKFPHMVHLGAKSKVSVCDGNIDTEGN